MCNLPPGPYPPSYLTTLNANTHKQPIDVTPSPYSQVDCSQVTTDQA